MAAVSRSLPAVSLSLVIAICVGYFIDSGLYLLLLLSSSSEKAHWWVTAIVLANLIPPVALAAPLGWIVDRAGGRFAWAGALVISGICAMGIASADSLFIVVTLAAIQATCAIVISAAVFKFLPHAPRFDERSASSTAVGLSSIAAVAAPPLAAATASWSMSGAFWLCGFCYIAAGITVMSVAPEGGRIHVEHQTWHEILLGSRSLRHLTAVKYFLPAVVGVVVVTSMEGVAGVFYLQDVASSAIGYALLLSAWAAGSLVGAVMSGRPGFPLSATASVFIGGLLVSAALLIEGLIAAAVVIGVVFLVGGTAGTFLILATVVIALTVRMTRSAANSGERHSLW